MAASNADFFLVRKEQSFIKASIVSKYFWVWAKVMANRVEEFYYVDLFSGQGKYEDGSESTPLLIIKNAISDPLIRTKLRVFFNDENSEYIAKLKSEIEALAGIESLKYPIVYSNKDVFDISLSEVYPNGNIKPTLLFVDPFGYNGLQLDFFKVIKSWGSEVIFFFNYKRINMAISNPVFNKNMKRLFGDDLFNQLAEFLDESTPNVEDREEKVTETICQRISSIDEKIIRPLHYRFRDERGTRTIHHLFFATKHELGYAKMKEIMMGMSSEQQEGVGMMEFNKLTEHQPRLLPDFSIPVLKKLLLEKFAGTSHTVEQIYFIHNIGKPYIEKNYKEALRQLEASKQISCEPPRSKRRSIKGIATMADSVIITFFKL
ncbi:three-Cys-motif partner protein TcmP [Spirosoma validum]|uniref:Three-Cys-motif partner protein TcmP n=1 Tax=Spirosoma validum TaxID=2771355 RepID=A0A927AYB5_9BACT|nr:three-Cys-motif partner protein TcmP [Spirosoma validum]MBD2751998.1 three-Cys-motif partner protein TcmP [Spirosoma validum]